MATNLNRGQPPVSPYKCNPQGVALADGDGELPPARIGEAAEQGDP
jgi:hypothetical protein